MQILRQRKPYESVSIEVESPDGDLFLTIIEDEQKQPLAFTITIGKAGTSIAAWGSAFASLMTEALPKLGINGLIEKLSGNTSGRPPTRTDDGEKVSSSIEAITIALMKYRKMIYTEHLKRLGIRDEDEDDRRWLVAG